MRCDDVFEILTAGPFPRGASADEAVEQHLRCCFECRSFAEALRPISNEDGVRQLPAYQGELPESQDGMRPDDLTNRIQSLVEREYLSRETERQKQAPSQRSLSRLIVACAAVFVLGAAAAFAGPLLVERVAASPTLASNASTLHAVSLPPGGGCGSQVLGHLKKDLLIPVNFRESRDACCLKCHGGDHPIAPKRSNAIGLVVMSCQKCHVERTEVVKL